MSSSAAAPILELRSVSKRYGRNAALRELSFVIPAGACAAFVGSNGAGKTTTYAAIGGFISPSSGEIRVAGRPLAEYRRAGGVIGVLPQDAQFFEDRSLERQLFLFARLAGMGTKESWQEVARVLSLVSLSDKAKARPEELSRGMRVRFGIAQALVGSPPLVLLDEPMAGLDPFMIDEFRALVSGLKGKTTVVISSHQLHELESLVDYVVMIDQGQLVKQGSLAEIRRGVVRGIQVRVAKLPSEYGPLETQLPPGVTLGGWGVDSFQVFCADSATSRSQVIAAVAQRCAAAGVEILSIDTEGSLAEAFRQARGRR